MSKPVLLKLVFSWMRQQTSVVGICEICERKRSGGRILCCKPLKTTTKAVDAFNIVKKFFLNHERSLDMVDSLCTDRAPAMLGNKSGFASLAKKEIPLITVTHCMLHRHALASKSLPEKLKNVLSIAVNAVNYIRRNAFNHRLFKTFATRFELSTAYFFTIPKQDGFLKAEFLLVFSNCAKKLRCFTDNGVTV